MSENEQPTRAEVHARLAERDYRSFPVNATFDRHDANWQKRSGVLKVKEGEWLKGYVDVREWRHDKYAHRPEMAHMPDGYEVGACFETPHGWVNFMFYGLNGQELLKRLPTLEAEVRALQERLMGEEVRDDRP